MKKYSVPFYLHSVGAEELELVTQVLAGPILTTGEMVGRFEEGFADYLSAKYAVGVTSCTAGLHIALEGLGIGRGDEVITTPQTFIATATAIIQAGAKPVFVDVEADTGNLDVSKIEAAITPRTKAVMPVHLYGQMCDMKALRALADKHSLKIIEDCAHALESTRDGIKPGQLSDAACFSFFATKAITSGEGGAVTTNDPQLAAKLKLLRCHGMNKTAADRHKEGYQHWDMVEFGWKYNMDNIQAALLFPQLKKIESNVKQRQVLANHYSKLLQDVSGVRLLTQRAATNHARHLLTIQVAADRRDAIIQAMIAQGVGVVVNYRAIHLLTYFVKTLGHKRGDFPNAEKIGDETISLPLFPKMTLDQVEMVVAALKTALSESAGASTNEPAQNAARKSMDSTAKLTTSSVLS